MTSQDIFHAFAEKRFWIGDASRSRRRDDLAPTRRVDRYAVGEARLAPCAFGVAGRQDGPPGTELTINVEHVMVGGRTIRGIIEGGSNADVFLPKLVELFMKGRFPIDKPIAFYSFADINAAVEDALSGKVVKPVLRF